MEDVQNENEQVKSFPKFLLPLVGVIVVALLAAGATAFGVRQKPEVLGLSKGTQSAQEDVKKLLIEVGKLITLPQGEDPTVATVTDIEKVKEQPFFKNAKNGDRVIIYTNAKKAILYRPSEKRIIEVGAVNINQQPIESEVDEEENNDSETPNPTPEEENE